MNQAITDEVDPTVGGEDSKASGQRGGERDGKGDGQLNTGKKNNNTRRKLMAAASLVSLSLHLRNPEVSGGSSSSARSRLFASQFKPKRPFTTPQSSISETPKPQIELEFLGPKAGADGSYPIDRAWEISGEKLLRNIMLDNKIELYAAYGKVMNCGGGGSCGTCIVEIIDGKDLLNERTDTEIRYLKKKPESWRLSCQTIVGNKENAGKVVVQRLPQWKK